MGSLPPQTSPEPSLWHQSLLQFDALALNGKLLHGPYTTHLHHEPNLTTAFQLAPHLNNKPVLPADAPERKTNNVKSNPFANPDPDFVLPSQTTGPHHILMLNKFCVYRPSLLLITKEYAPQSRPLDARDLRAVWEVLVELEREAGRGELVVIYNCGAESGSSQGHKHMQIFPRPRVGDDGEGAWFEMFPERSVEVMREGKEGNGAWSVGGDVPGVAHKHFVGRLTVDADAETVVTAHEVLRARMLGWVEQWRLRNRLHGAIDDLPHNVVMTRDWMCLIPRRTSGSERGTPANALGMVGVVWTTREGEADVWEWQSGSAKEHLAHLGYPVD